ncbi:hypothetical protein ACPZ19_40360 [Amycolatopsis lurida]
MSDAADQERIADEVHRTDLNALAVIMDAARRGLRPAAGRTAVLGVAGTTQVGGRLTE